MTKSRHAHYDFITSEGANIQVESRVCEGQVEIFFGSEYTYLDLIQDVSDRIGRMVGFDDDTRYWVALSIRESVINAIQHGNKLDKTKRVGIRFRILADRLVISVRDEGEGFDESAIPDPLHPENLLKPGGRGVFYIRSFMDEVQYTELPGGGLELKMEKQLNHTQQGENHEN